MRILDKKESLSRTRLLDIFDRIQSLKVGVIGDFTLDAYWYADMTRSQLSRETPLFPRPVVRETYSPGGAANVAWNLADLRPKEVMAFTVFGADWRGQILKDCLHKVSVNTSSSLTVDNWSTPLFGKVVLTNEKLMQEDSRLDFINSTILSENRQEELFLKVQERLPELDALIIADYQACGVFGERLRMRLNELTIQKPALICIADSRQKIGSYHGMILKPNEVEAGQYLFPGRELNTISEQEWLEAGNRLSQQSGKAVYLTKGELGCWLFSDGQFTHIPSVKIPPPIDPVGAGDTFVAALAACLAAGAKTEEAGIVATLASAVTVKTLHITGTASPVAILSEYDAFESDPE